MYVAAEAKEKLLSQMDVTSQEVLAAVAAGAAVEVPEKLSVKDFKGKGPAKTQKKK